MIGRRPALAVLSTCLVAACSAGITTGTSATAPGTSRPLPSPTSPATLLTVFDGDTVLAILDGREEEIRLLGINAPERDECYGNEARGALVDLLEAGPLGLEALGERDQFDRRLAYAYAGETPVNLALVEDGAALALHEDHARAGEFLQAAEQAYRAGRGLWAPDACGAPSPSGIVLAKVAADPPGPDENDLNGEWVLLENRGEGEIDLSGWILRDESSQNRYRFPGGTVLGPGDPLRVHTGEGRDGEGRLYWDAPGPVWNNRGDTALLLDPAGNVVDRLVYSEQDSPSAGSS